MTTVSCKSDGLLSALPCFVTRRSQLHEYGSGRGRIHGKGKPPTAPRPPFKKGAGSNMSNQGTMLQPGSRSLSLTLNHFSRIIGQLDRIKRSRLSAPTWSHSQVMRWPNARGIIEGRCSSSGLEARGPWSGRRECKPDYFQSATRFEIDLKPVDQGN